MAPSGPDPEAVPQLAGGMESPYHTNMAKMVVSALAPHHSYGTRRSADNIPHARFIKDQYRANGGANGGATRDTINGWPHAGEKPPNPLPCVSPGGLIWKTRRFTGPETNSGSCLVILYWLPMEVAVLSQRLWGKNAARRHMLATMRWMCQRLFPVRVWPSHCPHVMICWDGDWHPGHGAWGSCQEDALGKRQS